MLKAPTFSETETRTGFFSAVFAYLWWGAVLPVFLISLRGVAAEEVLIHRILWSVPFGALILTARKQWPEIRKALGDVKVMLALAGSSTMIAINWLIYIMAVQQQHLFEAALGYYINPLVYVLAGVLLLGEKLTRKQIGAVILAAIGVSILTIYGGALPWVSVTLAISFTAYGYLRKMTPVGAMPGLFIETLILAPVALFWMLVVMEPADQSFGGPSSLYTFALIAAGPITVVPLLAFAIGARRLPLSVLGFLQFIGPTLQFVVGLIDGEPFTLAHQICFAFIWLATGLFAWDAIRKGRDAAALKREALVKREA